MPIAINKMKQLTLYFALWLTACTAPTSKERATTTDSNVLLSADTALVQADIIALPSDPAVVDNGDFLAYAADPGHIKMYWKKNGQNIYTFQELKKRNRT